MISWPSKDYLLSITYEKGSQRTARLYFCARYMDARGELLAEVNEEGRQILHWSKQRR